MQIPLGIALHLSLPAHGAPAAAVTIPSSDPQYRQKRDKLAALKLSTQQTFQLQRDQVALLLCALLFPT